jgi:hypothetical protein
MLVKTNFSSPSPLLSRLFNDGFSIKTVVSDDGKTDELEWIWKEAAA